MVMTMFIECCRVAEETIHAVSVPGRARSRPTAARFNRVYRISTWQTPGTPRRACADFGLERHTRVYQRSETYAGVLVMGVGSGRLAETIDRW